MSLGLTTGGAKRALRFLSPRVLNFSSLFLLAPKLESIFLLLALLLEKQVFESARRPEGPRRGAEGCGGVM